MAARPLRVVRLIARLNIGGPARHVTILDRGLRARGHATMLAFGTAGTGEGSLEDLAAGLPVCRIPELGRRISLLGDLAAFARIFKLLLREKPHILHTHTAKAGTLGRLAAAVYNFPRRSRRRVRVVHTFHGHVLEGYFGPAGDALVRTAERTLARLTDRIVAISARQRRDLTERFKVCRPAQVSVIPLGLDLDELRLGSTERSSLRSALGIADAAIVIGFVGRLVPIKDPLLLVEAFAEVVAAEPRVCLVIAGEGPLESEVRAKVSGHGLDSHVRFAGWRRDLSALYATCDVVVLASRNEGTPVAVIEAMACARPVVATAVGGVPDVIDDGETGLLVHSRSASQLSQALLRLVRDPAGRAEMGRRAQRVAMTRYRSERLVDDIERLYRELACDDD